MASEIAAVKPYLPVETAALDEILGSPSVSGGAGNAMEGSWFQRVLPIAVGPGEHPFT
jgi:hypothetical protein